MTNNIFYIDTYHLREDNMVIEDINTQVNDQPDFGTIVTNLRDTLADVQRKFGTEAIEDIIPQIIALSSSYNRLTSSIDTMEVDLKSMNEQLVSVQSALDTEKRLRQSAEASAIEWEEQTHQNRICANLEKENVDSEVRDLEREIQRLQAELEARSGLEKIIEDQSKVIESLETTTARQAEDLDLMVGEGKIFDSTDSWDIKVDEPVISTSPTTGTSRNVESILNKSITPVTANIAQDRPATQSQADFSRPRDPNSVTISSKSPQRQDEDAIPQHFWSEGIQKILDSAEILSTIPEPPNLQHDFSFGDITLLNDTARGQISNLDTLFENSCSGDESASNSSTSEAGSHRTANKTKTRKRKPNRKSLAFEISSARDDFSTSNNLNIRSDTHQSKLSDDGSKLGPLASFGPNRPRSHCRVGVRHLSQLDHHTNLANAMVI